MLSVCVLALWQGTLTHQNWNKLQLVVELEKQKDGLLEYVYFSFFNNNNNNNKQNSTFL